MKRVLILSLGLVLLLILLALFWRSKPAADSGAASPSSAQPARPALAGAAELERPKPEGSPVPTPAERIIAAPSPADEPPPPAEDATPEERMLFLLQRFERDYGPLSRDERSEKLQGLKNVLETDAREGDTSRETRLTQEQRDEALFEIEWLTQNPGS